MIIVFNHQKRKQIYKRHVNTVNNQCMMQRQHSYIQNYFCSKCIYMLALLKHNLTDVKIENCYNRNDFLIFQMKRKARHNILLRIEFNL
jgi:hypothetical protein